MQFSSLKNAIFQSKNNHEPFIFCRVLDQKPFFHPRNDRTYSRVYTHSRSKNTWYINLLRKVTHDTQAHTYNKANILISATYNIGLTNQKPQNKCLVTQYQWLGNLLNLLLDKFEHCVHIGNYGVDKGESHPSFKCQLLAIGLYYISIKILQLIFILIFYYHIKSNIRISEYKWFIFLQIYLQNIYY